MNRSNPAAALVLLALAGCTSMEHGFGNAEARTPRNVTVHVVNGAVSVEDPVDLFENNGSVRWAFGNNPQGYVFPEGGIRFDPHPPSPPASMGCTSFPNPDTVFKNCKPLQRGTLFQCVKTGPQVVNACFKYDIKVELPGGGSPIKVDPWVRMK